MSTASTDEVQALRNRIQTLLDEDLPEEHLIPLWPSIETEWVLVFPETQALFAYLKQQALSLRSSSKALGQLVTVCDRHLGNVSEAVEYQDETEKLKQAVAEMLKKYDSILNKR